MRSTARLLPFAFAALLAAGCSASGGPADTAGSPAGPGDPVPPDTGSAAMSDTIDFTGTVRHSELEGGFYAIVSDDGTTYDPQNLAEEFRVDGLRVQVRARIRRDMGGIHQVGPIIEIVEIRRQ